MDIKNENDYRREGGPAFAHGNRDHGGHPGMTLRDWFAGQALAGLSSIENLSTKASADIAYQAADYMLRNRS